MPAVEAAKLRGIIETLLVSAGASREEGKTVARHSVAANLAGHDSHGVIQIPIYIDRIDKGHIVPGAPFEITQESSTSTVVDGNWGFGYVVAERATRMTIEKAKAANVAATTIVRQSHIGRVAAYPLMAAREGMIAIMTADSGRGPKAVAPFGGREARLGTNPICIAVPAALEEPLVVDMATSAVAAGKVKLAQAKGVNIPEGWVVDGEGRATTDPFAYGKGGVLAAAGRARGPQGLRFVGDGRNPFRAVARSRVRRGAHRSAQRRLLSCRLQHGGIPRPRHVQAGSRRLRDLPQGNQTGRGFRRGPLSGRNRTAHRGKARNRDGVPIDDETWGKLAALAEKYGVSDVMGDISLGLGHE